MSGIIVIVGPRVRSYLELGSLFNAPERLDDHGYGQAGRGLVNAVNARPASKPISLLRSQALILAELADDMLGASRDDAAWDPGAKGDVAAARRLLANLDRQGVTP